MPTTYPFNSAQLRGIASIAEANRVTLTEVAGGVDLEFFREAATPAPDPVVTPTTPAAGSSVLRFDFGPEAKFLEPGFVRVTHTSPMWSGRVSSIRDICYTRDATLTVPLPNGLYDVTPFIGDTGPHPHEQQGVYLQGELVDTVSTGAGKLHDKTHRVRVTDGRLTLRLKDLGGKDDYVCIHSLAVVPAGSAQEPPVPPTVPPTSGVDEYVHPFAAVIPQIKQSGDSCNPSAIAYAFTLCRAAKENRVVPSFNPQFTSVLGLGRNKPGSLLDQDVLARFGTLPTDEFPLSGGWSDRKRFTPEVMRAAFRFRSSGPPPTFATRVSTQAHCDRISAILRQGRALVVDLGSHACTVYGDIKGSKYQLIVADPAGSSRKVITAMGENVWEVPFAGESNPAPDAWKTAVLQAFSAEQRAAFPWLWEAASK